MFSPEITFLGLALAMDAAVVAFAIGLINDKDPKKVKIRRSLVVSIAFGFFQFAMIWAGSYFGHLLSYSKYGHLFQLVIALIFFLIASKLVQESFSNEARALSWGFISVLVLAFATSVDAMASGVSLGTLPKPYLAAMDIGLITFIMCLLFYWASNYFKTIPEKLLLRFAALIFIILGSQTILGLLDRGII